MTVTGATTAGVASAAYTPPFKSVSSNPAAVQITGSVTSERVVWLFIAQS